MTQIKLEIAVFGDLLDQKRFSQIIKLAPTSYWSEGDIVSNNTHLKRKETCWEYSSDFIQTLHLENIYNSILQKFSDNIEVMSSYIKKNKLETKVDVVVKIFNDETPALTFNKDFMDLVVKMNGRIDIDLYYY